MKFITNIFDPEHPDAKANHTYSYDAAFDPIMREHEWKSHLKWIAKFTVGDPHPTDYYSVEQLKSMNMVGLYE